ncbi:hypothetical protein TWF696_007620 [Orbilia brochopaga]|uniref:Uncharacterized protein n=1 Tax=Orbilia brochopaga TaxID=3140254 RepID=A0AAV9ULI0_9PEZI
MLKTVFAALLVTAASSAILPTRGAQDDRPEPFRQYLWWSKNDTTQDVVKATDDAWAKIDLLFPLKIFNKSSSTIWVSMNGIVSLDEPNLEISSVPERPLPVDPEIFSRDGATTGYFPANAIAPFWRDMSMKAAAPETGVWVQYIHQEGAEYPQYHIYFRACDKAEKDWAAGRERCGKGTRNFILMFGMDKPGTFQLMYLLGGEKDIQATVGVQSYPDYMSIPISTFYNETMECSMVSVDTNTRNLTVTPFSFCI